MRADPGRAEIVSVGASDWRAWRELRLEGLADTPIGFGELHADALTRTDEDWQAVMDRPGFRVMAFDGGRPIGMAGGFRDVAGEPILFAVYVTPPARGNGVLESLVAAVRAWAAPDRLVLDVHEDNERAHRAYLRLGFMDTGERTSKGGIDGRDLVRMRLP